MSTCIVDGVQYESKPAHGCSGCAAEYNDELCHKLAPCVFGGGVWVMARSPAPLPVPIRRSTPAGLYKPTHGGYPGV